MRIIEVVRPECRPCRVVLESENGAFLAEARSVHLGLRMGFTPHPTFPSKPSREHRQSQQGQRG